MIKNIDMGNGQTIEINTSNGWLYTYQEQFGHDVLPVLLPAVEALLGAFSDIMKKTGTDDAREILANIDEDTISDMFITLSGMQLTTVTNIVWAMAKNADNTITNPKDWINQFEVFPWDIIVPQAIGAAIEACISKKKFEKIRGTMKSLNLSASNESQSPQSTED